MERYRFVLDGNRVLGEGWVCRGCLDALLRTDRITIGGDGASTEAETDAG